MKPVWGALLLTSLLSMGLQPAAAANVEMSVFIHVEPTTTTIAAPTTTESTTSTSTTILRQANAVLSAPAAGLETTTTVELPPVVGYAVASESGNGLITSLVEWLRGWL